MYTALPFLAFSASKLQLGIELYWGKSSCAIVVKLVERLEELGRKDILDRLGNYWSFHARNHKTAVTGPFIL
jgi:hypothetical protein